MLLSTSHNHCLQLVSTLILKVICCCYNDLNSIVVFVNSRSVDYHLLNYPQVTTSNSEVLRLMLQAQKTSPSVNLIFSHCVSKKTQPTVSFGMYFQGAPSMKDFSFFSTVLLDEEHEILTTGIPISLNFVKSDFFVEKGFNNEKAISL